MYRRPSCIRSDAHQTGSVGNTFATELGRVRKSPERAGAVRKARSRKARVALGKRNPSRFFSSCFFLPLGGSIGQFSGNSSMLRESPSCVCERASKFHVHVGQNRFGTILGGICAPPILGPILVGIESDVHWEVTIWILTHGHVSGGRIPRVFSALGGTSWWRSRRCTGGRVCPGTACSCRTRRRRRSGGWGRRGAFCLTSLGTQPFWGTQAFWVLLGVSFWGTQPFFRTGDPARQWHNFLKMSLKVKKCTTVPQPPICWVPF